MSEFIGLYGGLHDLWKMSSAKTRSISPENPTGAKGAGCAEDPWPDSPARELGRGWKTRPHIRIETGQRAIVADIEGPGAIKSLWFAGPIERSLIIRIYWEGQASPSVECPITDFFAIPWAKFDPHAATSGPLQLVNSIPVVVNPNRGVNCFWEMPFRTRCKVEIENRASRDVYLCYQINYVLTPLPNVISYFHAQFRQACPVQGGEFTIVDAISGRGQFVGLAMGCAVHADGWWGEGEIKFYLDGDGEAPTICYTGTEDYFGGSYNWEVDGQYVTYSTPYMGMHTVLRPDGTYHAQHRHAMYRWHVLDPICFEYDLRVTIQTLGWRSQHRYAVQSHDLCSVAFWYQDLPTPTFPVFPDEDALEIL